MEMDLCNMRLTGVDKEYYRYQLEKFAGLFSDEKVNSVQFGKQDIRGSFSITLIDKRHCVPMQKHFTNKWEMLGFVVGFNNAKENTKGWDFEPYLKGGDENGKTNKHTKFSY